MKRDKIIILIIVSHFYQNLFSFNQNKRKNQAKKFGRQITNSAR